MSKQEDNNKIKPRKEQKLETTTPDNTIEEKKTKTPKTKKTPKKRNIKKDSPRGLNQRQKIFCREYAKTGNGKQSALKAGYSPKTAEYKASIMLKNEKVANEIQRINGCKEKKAIMDAQEVMELFSAIARGEIKDQFGLDATLADRLKAMNEIAKRTVDIENRVKGIPDTSVTIKLDWKKE